jgi:5'-nucleotidase
MKILLTNDDGIHSQGINALYKVLTKKHSVYIFAPTKEKSGCSSALSIIELIKIIEMHKNIFAVEGFTADCVNIGLQGELIPKVDLVISGINHGLNLGDDIYFSGTVAGARVAYIQNISGIAVSLDCRKESRHFTDASRFVLDYIEQINQKINNPFLLNINYPNLPANKIQGIRYSSLGRRRYNDSYKIISKENSELNIQFIPEIGSIKRGGSDISDLENGYIAITPLTLDCTDYSLMDILV